MYNHIACPGCGALYNRVDDLYDCLRNCADTPDTAADAARMLSDILAAWVYREGGNPRNQCRVDGCSRSGLTWAGELAHYFYRHPEHPHATWGRDRIGFRAHDLWLEIQ